MNTKMIQQQVDDIFASFNRPGSPGAAVAVVEDGNIVFQQAYGLGNIENKVPITPRSVFNIASISKQFTAFAIALLADDGKLSLDDDIRKYLPEFPEYAAMISIRHLIHHTSGIRNNAPALRNLSGKRVIDSTSTEDVFRLLCMQRGLNFVPGDEHEYSNSNYILLARIVAKVSGKSFSEFMEERVFMPLEMTNTVVNDSFFKLIPHRVQGYFYDNGKWCLKPLTDAVIGSTNIYSTVLDLMKWDRNFTTHKVGGQQVIEQMLECGILNDGTRLKYAFGLVAGSDHKYHGWQVVEHNGNQGGYTSHMIRFPEANLTVVMLFNFNQRNSRKMILQVADLLLEHHPENSPIKESREIPQKEEPKGIYPGNVCLNQYQGTYYCPDLEVYWQMIGKNDELKVKRRMIPESKLSAYSQDTFIDDWTSLMGYPTTYILHFTRNKKGTVNGLTVSGSGVRGLQFEKCAF